jgi:DNA processing protein
MREHLAVSQFPLGSPVRRGNFPRRNRVMALLSDATVIVEAGETSGSLSQGWEAIRLGRQLLILKSTVERRDLLWPRMMVDYGAEVLSDTERLLEQLPQEELAEVASVPAF